MSDKIIWEYKDLWGFWLINDEFLISKWKENWALDWDMVEAINTSKNPNIITYEIIKVIGETKTSIESISNDLKIYEWIYRKSNNWNWWYVHFSRTDDDIFIPSSNKLWLQSWDKINFSIIMNNWKKEWLLKEVVTKASDQLDWALDFFKDDKKIDVFKIATSMWAKIIWPEELLKEVDKLDSKIENSEILKRRDLRDLFTITIDWADSKDLDDAISIEKIENWYKLFVHIADVTHFVKENSVLDIEALDRATSIYLTDKVIPMLHEKLSNDLCSLNPNTDKLSMTCEMIIDEDWNIDVENSSVYESIINTNFRTTYKEIEDIKENKLLEWNELLFWWKVENKLLELVDLSKELAEKLNFNTRNKWELEFDFPETKVILDENWDPTWFKPYPKYPSNDYIKAFMVAANRTVWQKFENIPFLHRTHLRPNSQLVEKLNTILELLETNLSIDSNPSPKDFALLLEKIKWHQKENFLEKVILLTMQKANYTHTREWHFGLSIDNYSHFTSPIRRYPDLQIHRIIKEFLSWNYSNDRESHYESILEWVANKSSLEQDKSVSIEREVNKYYSVKYMQDKIWEDFEWYISSIDQRWVFVELDNTIKWTIKKQEKYNINSIWENNVLFELTDSNWKTYNVWDKLNFKLVEVDTDKLTINFEINNNF